MRWKNLIDCQKACLVPPDIKIYVSDNGDFKEAQKAGFIYCDVENFEKMMYTQFHIPDTPSYKRKYLEEMEEEASLTGMNKFVQDTFEGMIKDEIKTDLEEKK